MNDSSYERARKRAIDRTAPPRTRRMRKATYASIAAIGLAGVLLSSCTTPTAGGPPQPTTGPGANGPCTFTTRTIPDPAQSGQNISIYEPGGSASTPNMGGTCNDNARPIAAVVHGLAAGSPSLYQSTINHLASTGNVVIFATYNTDTSNFVRSFTNEFNAMQVGVNSAPRGNKAKFGVVGHSMGGGAIPFLIQKAQAAGWGTTGFWAQSNAPWTIAGVGQTITVPSNLRIIVENYQNDALVQNSTGVDMYRRLSLPASQKQYVLLNSGSRNGVTINTSHTTPNDIIAPQDTLKFYGIWRNIDALQTCSLLGQNCNTDFGFMGNWPDGTPFPRATSTDTP